MEVKKLKKFFAVLLSTSLLTVSLAGCSSSSNEKSTEGQESNNVTEVAETETQEQSISSDKTYVIGIAEAQSNDEVTIRRNYLENYVAKKYNVKFIFSEQCSDDAATKSFIENCIDSGADAIIDFKSGTAQMAQLCKDNGLIYTFNGNPLGSPTLMDTSLDNFAGFVGADNVQLAEQFAKWLDENASEDGSEGFLVATSLASTGNQQHVEITRAILNGLRSKYGLTYEDNIQDLIAATNNMDAKNDKGIQITVYPGSPNKETWLPGVSSLIQSGKYGVFMSSGQTYNQSATVVNEVESALNMNIKVASVAALGNTLTTAFNTQDPSGNPSVDFVTVKSVSISTAALFAITYNALMGGIEQSARGADGMPFEFKFAMIGVTSPDQLAQMEGWDDKDTQNWIANTNLIDSMLVTKNPDITADDIQNFLNSLNFVTIKTMME